MSASLDMVVHACKASTQAEAGGLQKVQCQPGLLGSSRPVWTACFCGPCLTKLKVSLSAKTCDPGYLGCKRKESCNIKAFLGYRMN